MYFICIKFRGVQNILIFYADEILANTSHILLNIHALSMCCYVSATLYKLSIYMMLIILNVNNLT